MTVSTRSTGVPSLDNPEKKLCDAVTTAYLQRILPQNLLRRIPQFQIQQAAVREVAGEADHPAAQMQLLL